MPVVEESGRALGARSHDIPIENGIVKADTGGMSVSPDSPLHIVRHRRPAIFGGTGRDPVWKIDSRILRDFGLRYRPDPFNPNKHGFIEPTREMSFAEYQQALVETRDEWILVEVTGGDKT